MPRYRNTDDHRRVWGKLQRPDGRTLELDPGEVVDLNETTDAPYLELVNSKPPEKAKE